jgi:hypothetical protein
LGVAIENLSGSQFGADAENADFHSF